LCGKINKICGGKKKKALVQKQLASQLATLDFVLFLLLYVQISPCLKRAQWLEHLFICWGIAPGQARWALGPGVGGSGSTSSH